MLGKHGFCVATRQAGTHLGAHFCKKLYLDVTFCENNVWQGPKCSTK